jgi:hypothetical protein
MEENTTDSKAGIFGEELLQGREGKLKNNKIGLYMF